MSNSAYSTWMSDTSEHHMYSNQQGNTTTNYGYNNYTSQSYPTPTENNCTTSHNLMTNYDIYNTHNYPPPASVFPVPPPPVVPTGLSAPPPPVVPTGLAAPPPPIVNPPFHSNTPNYTESNSVNYSTYSSYMPLSMGNVSFTSSEFSPNWNNDHGNYPAPVFNNCSNYQHYNYEYPFSQKTHSTISHEEEMDNFVKQLNEKKWPPKSNSSKNEKYNSLRSDSYKNSQYSTRNRSNGSVSPKRRSSYSPYRRRVSRSPIHKYSEMKKSAYTDGLKTVSKSSRTKLISSPTRNSSHSRKSSDRDESKQDSSDGCAGNEKKSEKELLEELEREVKSTWLRTSPAELYYKRDLSNPNIEIATSKLESLCNKIEKKLLKRSEICRETSLPERDAEMLKSPIKNCNEGSSIEEKYPKDIPHPNLTDEDNPPKTFQNAKTSVNSNKLEHTVRCANGEETAKNNFLIKEDCSALAGRTIKNDSLTTTNEFTNCHKHKKGCDSDHLSSNDDDNSSSSSFEDDDDDWVLKGVEEMERKKNHPDRLHPELWFNDPEQMNDGPLCRCSVKARRSGIRHGFYAGEEKLAPCNPLSNNATRLHHYMVTISPPTNFLVKSPTVIVHDDHEFLFEGFSLFSHCPFVDIPPCQVIRFNTEYTIYCIEDKMPENYCVKELDLFFYYFFHEILELLDFNLKAVGDENGCPRFHFMPRFVRSLSENGKEILSMNEVMNYLLKSSVPLIVPEELSELLKVSESSWLTLTDSVKGMLVTFPGKKPCSLRVDQIDRDQVNEDTINFPVIVHFGIRPPQLSYAGNPAYQKALKEYVKFRHLLANMPKPTYEDKRLLEQKEIRLQEMRTASRMKKDVTVAVSSEGAIRTGIMCDMVQHALLIPVLVRHLRFHQSLRILEERIDYKFKNRQLLQLALTHPSYRENFGTNPDHARNTLTNCGVRQPQYGDRKIHYMNTHKRGINTLINIMSRFGKHYETESKITHNERLEFLGDAVVEFLTSIHLFHLFPSLEEGGLATYRAAIVQNQQLSELAEKLGLHEFVLRAHGSDLCHQLELRHAMANCFEALMGAIFIDSSIEDADAVFSATLFKGEPKLHKIWVNYSPHPLQEQEPDGDRKWIETFPFLQKLSKFEEQIGIQFRHVRLLARAFTDRSIGFNYLTLGSNQRLEFLGDTVLQLVASEYLYKFFPEHHEGHLSLLRSSLVNNRTQAVVCDDLCMTQYSVHSHLKPDLKIKDRADLLEAFIGAVYIDRGLDYCRVFCGVCFFPRLQEFIIKQNWNDPKSKLQQCCLTLRTMEGGEPDIPVYKVIECKGPTNTRVYTVAVYFRNKRLAKASGHSIQQAEMNAAKEALTRNKDLFPHLAYQRRVIEKNAKVKGSDGKPDIDSYDREREERRRCRRLPRIDSYDKERDGRGRRDRRLSRTEDDIRLDKMEISRKKDSRDDTCRSKWSKDGDVSAKTIKGSYGKEGEERKRNQKLSRTDDVREDEEDRSRKRDSRGDTCRSKWSKDTDDPSRMGDIRKDKEQRSSNKNYRDDSLRSKRLKNTDESPVKCKSTRKMSPKRNGDKGRRNDDR